MYIYIYMYMYIHKRIYIHIYIPCTICSHQVGQWKYGHTSFKCVAWLFYILDATCSQVWHDAFICVTWRIHMCDMTHSYVWHDAFIRVTWRIHMCDMTHSYVWHDSFIHVWYISFICVKWLIHMCDMTQTCVWHEAFICVKRKPKRHLLVREKDGEKSDKTIRPKIHFLIQIQRDALNTWRIALHLVLHGIHVRDGTHASHNSIHDMTPSFVWCIYIYIRAGLWRCIGCLKLQVSSAKEPLIIGLFCRK